MPQNAMEINRGGKNEKGEKRRRKKGESTISI
jgi:hypothetical protein